MSYVLFSKVFPFISHKGILKHLRVHICKFYKIIFDLYVLIRSIEDQSQYLLNIYCVLNNRLCTWHMLFHLLLTNTLKLKLRPEVFKNL